MTIAPLDRSQLAAAELVLADACPFDRATEVAEEKLFEPGPNAPALGFGAWHEGRLVGVAAVSGKWLRVLAVAPGARRRGLGSGLLAACEQAARGAGERELRTLDQPGNYLAPGIDVRNSYAIGWLERRGYRHRGEPRANAIVAVRDNPRVTAERYAETCARVRASGYEVRRALGDEQSLVDAIAREFGGAWPWEVTRALANDPPAVHLATQDGVYCAFAAHDGNNRGLGWFGPTGTWPAHRGRGLGEAVLLACLLDVAADHARCEIAWIGPRAFYDKIAGVVDDRSFALLARALAD